MSSAPAYNSTHGRQQLDTASACACTHMTHSQLHNWGATTAVTSSTEWHRCLEKAASAHLNSAANSCSCVNSCSMSCCAAASLMDSSAAAPRALAQRTVGEACRSSCSKRSPRQHVASAGCSCAARSAARASSSARNGCSAGASCSAAASGQHPTTDSSCDRGLWRKCTAEQTII